MPDIFETLHMTMKLKLLTKSNELLFILKVGTMIGFIIPTFFIDAYLQYPIQFSKTIRLDLEVPYQDGVEEVFWDWDGDNVIYTSKFFYQPSSHTLTIHHKKVYDGSFKQTYSIDIADFIRNSSTFFMYDIAYNYQDSVIAIIANRGLILYKLNSDSKLIIHANQDTSFTQVFYHQPSNSFILHSLYFYHTNDVRNPEALYRLKYDVMKKDYTLLKYSFDFPELPYSLLISQFMDVDSLIVLTNLFQHQVTILDTNFKSLIVYKLGDAFSPPYDPDSLFIYRKNNMHKQIFQRLKLYDANIERIEKIYTTSNWIFVILKPNQSVEFDRRDCIILKTENEKISLVKRFSINYRTKPYTFMNLYNFTTDDHVVFRKNKIAVCTLNYADDLVIDKNSQKVRIKNTKKYTNFLYEENPKFRPTYALYVSDWSITK